jgi:hypothetical protein
MLNDGPMIWRLLLALIVVLPGIIATLFQLSVWPFESYPMFSRRVPPHKLRIFRIAYMDRNGALSWWKPHYYKLSEIFCSEATMCFRHAPPLRKQRLDSLFTRIEQCLYDDHLAIGASSICIVMRICQRDAYGSWYVVDRVITCRHINRQSTI